MIHTFDRAKNDASTVGVDAYIDPQYHAAIFISFEANAIHLRRGDVGIAPYGVILHFGSFLLQLFSALFVQLHAD